MSSLRASIHACLNSDTFCSFEVSNPRREKAPAIHAVRAALAAASAGTEIVEDERYTASTPNSQTRLTLATNMVAKVDSCF
jgi:hypothetical protein